MDLRRHIREIADFPRPGILFYDVSTLFCHAGALREAVLRLAKLATEYRPEMIAGIESRGFPLAAAIAMELDVGMLMIRKAGKLPGRVLRHSYKKEYGSDTLEIPEGLVVPGQRVVIVDDLLATGGTFAASAALLAEAGAVVPAGLFLVELSGLRTAPEGFSVPVAALVRY